MTVIVGIAAYVFGALTGTICVSCLIAGKKMDEKIRELEDEENE